MLNVWYMPYVMYTNMSKQTNGAGRVRAPGWSEEQLSPAIVLGIAII